MQISNNVFVAPALLKSGELPSERGDAVARPPSVYCTENIYYQLLLVILYVTSIYVKSGARRYQSIQICIECTTKVLSHTILI